MTPKEAQLEASITRLRSLKPKYLLQSESHTPITAWTEMLLAVFQQRSVIETNSHLRQLIYGSHLDMIRRATAQFIAAGLTHAVPRVVIDWIQEDQANKDNLATRLIHTCLVHRIPLNPTKWAPIVGITPLRKALEEELDIAERSGGASATPDEIKQIGTAVHELARYTIEQGRQLQRKAHPHA